MKGRPAGGSATDLEEVFGIADIVSSFEVLLVKDALENIGVSSEQPDGIEVDFWRIEFRG